MKINTKKLFIALLLLYACNFFAISSNTEPEQTESKENVPPPPPGPANDDCAGAITLTVGASCTYASYTNANATATTGVPAPGCANYLGGDVWFKVVVPASGHITIDSQTGGITDGGMALYTGTCGSLTLSACDDDGSANGLMSMIDATGLAPGSTVYIRFWEYGNDNNGTFSICVSDPPAATNNNCNQAISLTPGASCTATAGSVIGATQSQAGCLGTANDDVWFSFVATNTSQNISVTPSASFDPVVQVFSGTCASLTSITCNDATFLSGTTGTMSVSGLTVGQTYYYRVYDYYSGVPSTPTFTTCVTNPGVPNNQDCLGAIPICNNTYSTAIAYTGTGNILNEINSSISCLGAGEKHDVWYVFTVQASGNLNFSITPNVLTEDYDWAVYNLTTANCADIYTNGALEVSCNFSGVSGVTGPNGQAGVQNEPVVPVTAGQTYVINVSQYSATLNGYTINFGASTATIFDNVPPAFSSVNTPIACGATSLTFNFNENVKCNTVSTSDFTLTGPGGPYTITGWSSANCSVGAAYDNTFTINVTPPLTTSGAFQICLVNSAGSVADVCNNIAPPACFNFNITGVTATTSQTNPTCGGSNGSASIGAPAGGTAPYSYSWSNGGTTASISGLAAGTYTCTVTDNLGCSTVKTVTLTSTSALTLAVTPTHVCGGTLGTIFCDVTNGTPSYSYTGGPSAANNKPGDWTFNNVTAGTYNITVTDGSGCTATATAVVNNNTPLATFTPSASQCLTGNSFNFTNSGSSGAGYTYSWTFPSGTPATSTANSPTGVTWATPGTYTITHTVTHTASGCSATVTQNIVVYPMPVPNVTKNNVTCNGACNGNATASPTGGTTFTYLWSNGATTQTISSLCAGTYTVTVTNNNGCTATQTVTITQPAAMTLVTSRTDATCNGVCNGTGNVTPSGGSGTYTYLWDNGQTTQGATGLCAGNHTVTVTDASNPACTATATINISQPSLIVITPTPVNATCGLSNGSISVSVTGGNSPYTYAWSSGGATNSISGLNAGSYTVTVTDLSGCTKTLVIPITNTTAPTASITAQTNVSCNGGNNGSATVTAVGASPFTYTWSTTPAQTTATATGLTSGTYTVTVKDVNNCTVTTTATITQPAILNASISGQTNNLCFNGTNGTATVLATGGTTPYTYAWSTTPGQTGVTATGLAAGTYTVTVTDNRGCTKTTTVTITQPTILTTSISASTNVSCNGGNNGSATVLAGGATPGYTYAWSTTPVQTTATASGLTAGTYTVTVTDANGCTIPAISVTLTQPTALTASIVGTNVLCNGGTTGAANLTVSGGTSPYTYVWSNTASTEDLSNIPQGTYTVTITDSYSCTVTANVTINQPTAISLTPSSTNATCGAPNGTAGISASGGTSPYSYLWSNTQTTASISGLIAGAYTVTVTDANGCTANNTINVSSLGAPTASITAQTNVSCNGGTNGSATVTAASGVSPYTYSWTGGQTTATATNLAAGTYTVTVTDANLCSVTTSATISAPTALTASISAQTNILCNGGTNGSATVSASGGTVPYTYSWTGGQTTATATTLSAGVYTVTVTDFNGCTQTTTATISQPTILAATTTGVNVICNGGTTGTATANPTGGTTPYTYVWQNLQTTQTATGLSAGTYNVTVTDANSCTVPTSYTVSEPAAMVLTPSSLSASCGLPTGTASVAVAGGTPAYTYLWSTAETTPSITNIAAGSYSVTVTDANTCTQNISVNVSNTGAPTATLTVDAQVTCNGLCNGEASVVASGGTPPYVSYSWSNLASGASVTGLCAGTVSVTVTDFNGCSATASGTVNQPTALTSLISAQTNITCNAGTNGSATVSASGGTTNYSYSWSNGNLTANATNLAQGIYSVTTTDALGCTSTASVTITEPTAVTASAIATDVSCNGSTDGTATVTPGGGVPGYTYSWNNGASGLTAGSLAAGTYTVTVTDASGCTAITTATVNSPTALTGTASSTPETIFGLCNGTATASPTGGTGALTYIWSDGSSQSTQTATNLCVGTYTVTVTDINGCTVVLTTTVVGPGALTLTPTGSAVNCNGDCNGTVDVAVSGGQTPYTYSWTGGQTTATATGLCAGTYTVTVTDFNGAIGNATATVTEPTALTSSISSQTNILCNGGNNGSATVSPTGGTLPYSYSWTGGQTTATATNLTAGTYTVTVTDALGCISTSIATINEPSAVTASATGTDVLCNGGATGTATVVAGGGTPGYSYLWSNGATTASPGGFISGTYNVTVTDLNGCTATTNVIINQPTALGVTISSSIDASGFGASDGSATALGNNGTPEYTYDWSNGSAGTTVSGLSAGTYTVTVTDLNGCTTTTTVTINEPGALIVTLVSSTDVTCNSACDGTATISVTGGVPTYTYLWSTGSTNQNPSGLCAGTHTVTVTDANGFTGTVSVVINQPVLLSASETTNLPVTCNGGTNGSASITATGGVTNYSYLWSNGNTGNSITNVVSGNYTVTVTDANLCTATVNLTITQPNALAVTVTAVGANCGQPQGSLSANPTGGTMPYTYNWNSTPAQTTQTASNLVPGSYSVTVTDLNNCTITGTGTISNLPGVGMNIKFTTNTLCNGSCDGTAMMESTGGLTPYIYSCSSGFTSTTSATNVSVPNLCAGIYTFTVTDANGCQAVVTDTIFEPLPVVASISSSNNVSCNSGTNGSATVSGSGGTSPYTAVWSTSPAQNTLIASGLTAGTYNVTISDANLCTATTSVVISQPTALSLLTTANSAHCSQSDGSASVVASGGTVTTGYTYLWSGGTLPLTQASVSGLNSAGSPYTVTVTDNNACTATASVNIANLLPGTATISASTNITCNGANNGTATASIGGGQAPFTYAWSTTPVQTTITATNLSPGTVTVSITDGFNCVVTASTLITQPAQLANTFTKVNASCFGSCNGSLTSVVTGGTAPYVYNWSNLNNTSSITNLCAGNYALTITDAHNCTIIDTATITQPTQINITGVVTDANCNSNDGGVTSTVTGGTVGYTYQWSSGATGSNLSNVIAGSYTLSVTDGAGCLASQNFNINNIAGPTASISASSNITCFGANDGFATVSVNGGSLVYSYQWNTTPQQLTASATNLPQGIYSVTVTDVNTLCTVNASVTITEPAALTLQTIAVQPLCNSQCNGSATVVPQGGTAPYSYLWFGGGNNANDSINTGLCAGSYTIVVTDAHSCNTMQTVNVGQPTFISATVASTPQSCFDLCNGTATVNPAGGIPPYTYLWSGNNQSTITAVGLCAGPYVVTVTDYNGCNITANTNITAPAPLSTTANLLHVKCFGQSSGRIILNVSGGTPTYSFLWSNGATTQNLIGIPFGNYCVTITDQNSCSYDTCFIISQPPQLQVSVTHTDESCYLFCDGTITPTVTGGQTPYSYLWSNFSSTQIADSLCPGFYFITVTDFNNCQAIATTEIIGYDILSLLLVHVDTATCGQANGAAVIDVIGGSNNYTYQWPAGVSSNTSTATNLAAGFYTITVTDDHNCIATMDINISNAAGPVIDSIVVQNITCFGAQNGTLHAYYHGSTSTYNVVWSTIPQQTGDIASNLAPGIYSIIITDLNGCQTSTSRTITQPPLFQSAITNFADATCYGVCNGSVFESVNGGVAPYSYLWSNGATTNSITNVCAGNYTVTATDSHGCVSQNSITILQPDSLHIDPIITNVLCNGQSNGQIVANVTGGTGYFYNWVPNVSSNSVAAPLAAGTYTLIVTDYYDLNCSTTGTYVISEPEPISVSTGTVSTTCGLNNGMAYIIGDVHGGTSPYNTIWSPGNSSNDTLTNAASGTYQLQIIDQNNCNAVFPVFVPSIAPPVLNSLQTSNVSCNGGNDGSATINVKFGTGPFMYTWTPTVGSQTVIDTATTSLDNLVAGIYNVTITDNNGCPIQTAFIVNQPTAIHTFADGSRWICNGQSATITANASGGTPPYSFTWSNLPSQNQVQVVSPTTTTNYSVFVTDQRGCLSDTGTVTVFVFPNVSVSLTADNTNICKGGSTDLHAVASGGNGGPYNYHWESIYHNVQTYSDTTAFADWTVFPIDTTTYVVHAVDACHSPSIGDTITIVVWPVPQTSITVDKTYGCMPLFVNFNSTANLPNMTFVWNFDDPESNNNSSLDNNPTHIFEQDGDYNVSLTVTTEHGCSASDNQLINVYPIPHAEFIAYPEVVSLFHSTVEFTDITGDVNNWSWNFGDNHSTGLQNPEHTYDHAGTFNVTLVVRNEHGCKDTVTHPIIVEQEFTFYAPTAFDPNSPINNEFNPQGVGIDERNYSLFVYDRWGQTMFETTDLYEHWNGKFKNSGDYVKSGSYVWLVKLKDIHGRWHEFTGNVTVIR